MIIFDLKRILSVFFICCISLYFIFPNYDIYANDNIKDLKLHSLSYAIVDGNSDRVLIDKNGTQNLANASTTKILTCILVLENCDLNEYAKASANAAKQPKVKLGLIQSHSYLVKDLLYSMMLESYNDCAYALAEHISGDIESFAKLMNDKATEIGCTDSYFITPNGLDSTQDNQYHHSSSIDLCKIMKYCVWQSTKSKLFKQITQTKKYSFPFENETIHITNHNKMLFENSSVISGKTGFTSKAGYCYVCACEEGDKRYCITLLACGWPNNQNYKWIDIRKIIEYIEKNYILYVPKANSNNEIELDEYHFENYSLKNWGKKIKIQYKMNYKNKKYLIKNESEINNKRVFNNIYKNKYKSGEKIGYEEIFNNNKYLDNATILISNNIYKWDFDGLIKVVILEYIAL